MNHPGCEALAGRPAIDRGGAAGRLSDLLRRVRGALTAVQRRQRERRALARLDDRLLRDIGISREQALREARKPAWRA